MFRPDDGEVKVSRWIYSGLDRHTEIGRQTELQPHYTQRPDRHTSRQKHKRVHRQLGTVRGTAHKHVQTLLHSRANALNCSSMKGSVAHVNSASRQDVRNIIVAPKITVTRDL